MAENVASSAVLVSLSGEEYARLVADLGQRGILGGAAYDAVIARAAELAQVDLLITLNEVHFQRVWPDNAGRVVSPLVVAPPPAH